jgi:hypothetical protein
MRSRLEDPFEAHCFRGEHRRLQQSEPDSQGSPLGAHRFDTGAWVGGASGAEAMGLDEGAEDGAGDGLVLAVGAVEEDGPDDAVGIALAVGAMEEDGPDDGAPVGKALTAGAMEGAATGLVEEDGPDDGVAVGITLTVGAVDGVPTGLVEGAFEDGPDDGAVVGITPEGNRRHDGTCRGRFRGWARGRTRRNRICRIDDNTR